MRAKTPTRKKEVPHNTVGVTSSIWWKTLISVKQLVRKWRPMGVYLFTEVLTVSTPAVISGDNWMRGLEEKEEVRQSD